MRAYERIVTALFEDEIGVDVAGVSATIPSLSPAHLTNERPVLRDFLEQVETTDGDVWDVGAAVGLFTVPAAKVTAGDVYAFEPFPRQYERLEANVARNDVADAVTHVRAALADRDGRRRFDADAAALSTAETGALVDVWSGDEFAADRGIDAPAVVKIDVEGAELDVLAGIEEILRADECEAVYVELHPDRLPSFDASAEDVHAMLSGAGFDVERLSASADGRYTIKGVDR